jgi:hypothetical protein
MTEGSFHWSVVEEEGELIECCAGCNDFSFAEVPLEVSEEGC